MGDTMITLLILIFTAIHSPLTWGTAILPTFCYGVGMVIVGFVGYKAIRGQLPATPLDLPLILIMLVASVSSWLSIWRLGSQVRLTTLIAYIAAYYFIYLGISEEILTRNVIRAGWVFIGAYLAMGIYRLWMPAVSLHDLGNGNVLAATLLLILPFGQRLPRRLRWIWFIAGAMAMLTTHSRGGLLGLTVALGLLWGIDKKWLIGIGLVSLPILFLWKKGSAMIRLCYWQAAIEAFISSPLLGIGPASCYQWITPRCELAPHAHNIFLTILAEMGIIGLAVFGLLLWQIWQHHRPGPAWAALCGFMVHSLVDDPIWFWSVGLGVMSLLAIMLKGKINEY